MAKHSKSSLFSYLDASCELHPENGAILLQSREQVNYEDLVKLVRQIAAGLIEHGLTKNDRVGVYLNKTVEAIASFYAINLAGGIFIPINPVLKGRQVSHILNDSQTRFLITTQMRYASIASELDKGNELAKLICVDGTGRISTGAGTYESLDWGQLLASTSQCEFPRRIDQDIASIFYTSGSTGKPKGVVLTNSNMASGAESVATYLNNTSSDRILAVLPLSFDYGFSQITTAFLVGAAVVPLDHLLARDVVSTICRTRITGLAGVPPLWVQLAAQEWPMEAGECLRYCTNSGGRMPKAVLAKLRRALPRTDFYLMYGLTEAFRSTFLPPHLVDAKPDSIGKAIPNAEILVVDEQGKPCPPGQPGELVHRGCLVAAGYWRDPEKTAIRFRPSPMSLSGIVVEELVVWSGDKVIADEDGFLYFVGRDDEMIKSSGYRISPTEVEEAIYESGLVADAMVTYADDPEIGAVVLAAIRPNAEGNEEMTQLTASLRSSLPAYMLPKHIFSFDSLPKNPNGKLDRPAIRKLVLDRYADEVDSDV